MTRGIGGKGWGMNRVELPFVGVMRVQFYSYRCLDFWGLNRKCIYPASNR